MKKPSLSSLKEQADAMELAQAVAWLLNLSKEYGESAVKLADKYNKRLEAERKETDRLIRMMEMEREAYAQGFQHIGGVDEAGRGPLAGPVVAACVILPKDTFILKINDSKKLTPEWRDKLFDEIRAKALAYGIGVVESSYIDEVNILNATKKAMELAIQTMKIKPDYLIIDAVRLPIAIRQKPIPKADANSITVAAASILAKVTRDRIMGKMDDKYPGYGFSAHKGYGTEEHYEAIKRLGFSPIHRRSFLKNLTEHTLTGSD